MTYILRVETLPLKTNLSATIKTFRFCMSFWPDRTRVKKMSRSYEHATHGCDSKPEDSLELFILSLSQLYFSKTEGNTCVKLQLFQCNYNLTTALLQSLILFALAVNFMTPGCFLQAVGPQLMGIY